MPLLAYFTAKWCPPCRMIAPIFEQLAEENHKSINFVKIDIDKSELTSIVSAHNVSAVPTFIGYVGKKTIGSFSGADKDELAKMVHTLNGA